MSDITPMAAVPSEVNYGRIRANFVAFIADDNGNVLEEVPLEGNVILTPTVGVLRFPSTSPPRTAVIQTLQCPVIGGILYPPGTPLGGPFPSQTGVAAVASDQPAGLPTTVQWTASFSLENTSAQPNPVTFEVPSGGVVDLTTVMPATPEPGIVVVVSAVDRERAEAAADTAETARSETATARDDAVTARDQAVTAKNLAEGFAGDAETALTSTLAAAVHELRGEGRPGSSAATNGALPGTYYTDVLGTAGAWRWLKTTAGSGVDRWSVVHGDTGWRDISGTVVEGASVSALRVRRVGVSVFLFGRDLVGRSGGYLGVLHAGFGGIATTLHVPAEGVATKRIVFPSPNPREMWVYGTVPHVNHVFATSEPWPTTLPGTPA